MKIKPNIFSGQEPRITIKTLSDGRPYKIRESRFRYFFPDEFQAFYDVLKKRQKVTFNFLINTGCRINEARHILVSDIDFDRKTVIIRWTKGKNKDGTRKIRIIPVSTLFIKWIKKVILYYKLKSEDRFPLLTVQAANSAMKNALRRINIKDWQNFSVHNVRKTLETWLIALDVDSLKVAKHFGHNIAVASKYYVSSDTFNYEDKSKVRQIIGDLYQRRGEYV